MDVWNACGIRDYEVIPEHDGIGLFRVEAHGVEQYHIAIQIENREEELISCPNAFEALRAYRYYSLLRQCLNAVIDRMIPEFPQLTNERERLCEMAMR